jgi:hypothetical protein
MRFIIDLVSKKREKNVFAKSFAKSEPEMAYSDFVGKSYI